MTWEPDVLPGFEALTTLLPDDAGPVPVTLVRLTGAPAEGPAVLYLHGYNDYFFQTDLAHRWQAHGHRFYALDLRRCGRSWRAGQTPHDCTSLRDYWPDLVHATTVLRAAGHEQIVVNAHSTGGLIAALWAHAVRDRDVVSALVLNSPFLDVRASAVTRLVGARLVDRIAALAPDVVVQDDGSAYAAALHRTGGGEWDFDLTLKRPEGVPARAGWLRAVRRGQARVAAGLDLPQPVLVACSDGPGDVVVDADRVARLAPRLGDHVTVVRVPGGLHDLALSAAPVREAYFTAVFDWLAAGPGPRQD